MKKQLKHFFLIAYMASLLPACQQQKQPNETLTMPKQTSGFFHIQMDDTVYKSHHLNHRNTRLQYAVGRKGPLLTAVLVDSQHTYHKVIVNLFLSDTTQYLADSTIQLYKAAPEDTSHFQSNVVLIFHNSPRYHFLDNLILQEGKIHIKELGKGRLKMNFDGMAYLLRDSLLLQPRRVSGNLTLETPKIIYK